MDHKHSDFPGGLRILNISARQENPNAYDPWTEEADTELKQMWSEGTSVADIAAHFGRKQSAIITRLKKLGI